MSDEEWRIALGERMARMEAAQQTNDGRLLSLEAEERALSQALMDLSYRLKALESLPASVHELARHIEALATQINNATQRRAGVVELAGGVPKIAAGVLTMAALGALMIKVMTWGVAQIAAHLPVRP